MAAPERAVSRGVAPVLRDLVEKAEQLGLGYAPSKARAELRALLAVARAARRGCRTTCGYGRGGFEHGDECPTGRALARLRGAGKGKR